MQRSSGMRHRNPISDAVTGMLEQSRTGDRRTVSICNRIHIQNTVQPICGDQRKCSFFFWEKEKTIRIWISQWMDSWGDAAMQEFQDHVRTDACRRIGERSEWWKPTGWHTVKYDSVDGRYLYNRCHLIGYQLTGENANKKNLITGTRYLNVTGMLPFEKKWQIMCTIPETLYVSCNSGLRGDDLLAGGVEMEAESVKRSGNIFSCFCIQRTAGNRDRLQYREQLGRIKY